MIPTTTLLQTFRSEVNSSSTGALALGSRKQIWAILGPRNVVSVTQVFTRAHRARISLAKTCLEYGFAFWKSLYPLDNQLDSFLDCDLTNLKDQQSTAVFRMWEKRLYTLFEQLDDINRNPINYVALAAAGTANVVRCDNYFESEQFRGTDDGLIDLEEWDSAFCISVAIANGTPWELNSDAEARRQYWNWYLNVAVPATLSKSKY